MKNLSSYNNLFPALYHDEGSSSTRKERYETRCSGKDCKSIGNSILKINYINKTGYFCDRCTRNLLDEGLAVKTGNISIE
jgi:predicted SprT family Zn-dependent metalloprotease